MLSNTICCQGSTSVCLFIYVKCKMEVEAPAPSLQGSKWIIDMLRWGFVCIMEKNVYQHTNPWQWRTTYDDMIRLHSCWLNQFNNLKVQSNETSMREKGCVSRSCQMVLPVVRGCCLFYMYSLQAKAEITLMTSGLFLKLKLIEHYEKNNWHGTFKMMLYWELRAAWTWIPITIKSNILLNYTFHYFFYNAKVYIYLTLNLMSSYLNVCYII